MPLGKGAVGVEFQDVNFSYVGRNIPVLSNLNLKVCENCDFQLDRISDKLLD
jgi:ABC-type multidrug transport system fused ATPase/permease subunit